MIHPLTQNFQSLAHYNELANSLLYDACAALDHDALHLDRKAFFKSIIGTLNHILVADRVWMGRLQGPPLATYQLNEILYDDFTALRAARGQEDQRIRAFIQNMSDEFVMGALTWTNNAGKTRTQKLSLLMTHLFNHQTHHRGQVHNMLSQAGIQTPVLDLPWVLGDE